jgi:hypothetical protein
MKAFVGVGSTILLAGGQELQEEGYGFEEISATCLNDLRCTGSM